MFQRDYILKESNQSCLFLGGSCDKTLTYSNGTLILSEEEDDNDKRAKSQVFSFYFYDIDIKHDRVCKIIKIFSETDTKQIS